MLVGTAKGYASMHVIRCYEVIWPTIEEYHNVNGEESEKSQDPGKQGFLLYVVRVNDIVHFITGMSQRFDFSRRFDDLLGLPIRVDA